MDSTIAVDQERMRELQPSAPGVLLVDGVVGVEQDGKRVPPSPHLGLDLVHLAFVVLTDGEYNQALATELDEHSKGIMIAFV